jgi:hypothetical protein
MMNYAFGFEREVTAPSVTDLLKQFPTLPANVLVALAVWSCLQRTVTPQRVCGCGCGESVTGKAKFAGVACRKRLERERSAARAGCAKNLNFVLQYEIPVTIPCVTVPAKLPADDHQQPDFL